MAAYCLGLQQPEYTPSPSRRSSQPSSKKPSGKFRSTFKKVGQYFKDQADQPHSALHLTPDVRRPPRQVDVLADSRNGSQSYLYDDDVAQKLLALNGHLMPPTFQAPPSYDSTFTSRNSSSAPNSVAGPGIFQNMIRHQYDAENILQSYDALSTGRDGGYWVVYIHGGYFRDPKVDSTSLKPAVSQIEESDTHASLRKNISGYASINHRLSPHTGHPQDPAKTPAYTLNNARWPDQPNDVLAALRHLQRTYPASRNYVLAGHSVGATLAFIAALQIHEHEDITPPKALIGVSGIYDFPHIHTTHPDYEAMTKNGMDPTYFEIASPATHAPDEYREKWLVDGSKRFVVLAHSKDDGLVDFDQPEIMQKVLTGQQGFQTQLVELHGKHNEIWEKGTELVKAIEKTVELL